MSVIVCAFFGGPWADETKITADTRETWVVPMPRPVAAGDIDLREPAYDIFAYQRHDVVNGVHRFYPAGKGPGNGGAK